MLLYGLPPDDSADNGAAAEAPDDGLTAHQRAAAAVGGALEALLPALDANDDGKLRAAVALFNSVLSSVVALCGGEPGDDAAGEGGLAVGVDLQYWAVEVVERLMEVVRTLQAHEGAAGGDDGCVLTPLGTSPLAAGPQFTVLALLAARMNACRTQVDVAEWRVHSRSHACGPVVHAQDGLQ